MPSPDFSSYGPVTQDKAWAFMLLAGFDVRRTWRLQNEYYPETLEYAWLRMTNPWFLFETQHGLIKIGLRKRVVSVDWGATDIRLAQVTSDDVTQHDTMVHAWTPLKLLEYLQTLNELLQAAKTESEKTLDAK